jgi:predicted DNA-binding transcriptional regulator YafY
MTDKLERLTNLLLVLLAADQPLSLDHIVHTVEGYPEGHDAYRQAFERDKRLLREQGIHVALEPIPGAADALGYRIHPEDYWLPDLGLTEEEQRVLNLALAAVRVDERAGQDAAWKLGAGGTLASVQTAPLAALPSAPALPVLHEAIRTRTPVSFRHRGQRREIEPYGLLFRNGFWYVVGHDRMRDAPRSFRVDRIDGLPELERGATFSPPETSDWRRTLPDDPWMMGEGEELIAEVRVDTLHARMAEAEVGTAAVVERGSDGSIVVRLPVVNRDAFRSWVLEMLAHAEVISPEQLRRDVIDWVEPLAGKR